MKNPVSVKPLVGRLMTSPAFVIASSVLGILTLAASASAQYNHGTCTRNNPAWKYTTVNACPSGCNYFKEHTGSACAGTGGTTECTNSSIKLPIYQTVTTHCINNSCDFSNSFLGEGPEKDTPTC